jgi:Ca2+-binding EF-hand superfamily protein
MQRKKLVFAALFSTLLIGAAAIPSFAAPGGPPPGAGRPHHARLPAEVIYVQMLKLFDTNGDMKISKDELKTGVDKLFDQIDTNKDGQITPGELRVFYEARMQAWRDAHPRQGADQEQGKDQGSGQDQAQAGGEAGQPAAGAATDHQRPRWMERAMVMRAAFIFRKVDKDESGQISKQEAEDAADRLFTRMDRNGDGFISLDDMPDRPFL